MIKAFKTRIYPTKNQKEVFNQAFGIRRFVWNWALNNYLESLNNNVIKSAFDLQKELNNGLCKDKEYKWLNDVNSMVRQESLKDLGLSIKKYHEQQKKARKTSLSIPCEKYKPKFKSKKYDTKSFRIRKKNDSVFKILSKKHLSFTWTRTYGRINIKLAESISFLKECDIKELIITQNAGLYYACITYEKTNHKVINVDSNDSIGIDMGMKTPLTCYDSNNKSIKYHYPDKLKNKKNIQNIYIIYYQKRNMEVIDIINVKFYFKNHIKKRII